MAFIYHYLYTLLRETCYEYEDEWWVMMAFIYHYLSSLLHETCYEYEDEWWWLSYTAISPLCCMKHAMNVSDEWRSLSYTIISPLLSRLTALLSCAILNEWLQFLWRVFNIHGSGVLTPLLVVAWLCHVRLLPFQCIVFTPYNYVASLHAKPHT